MIRFDSDYIEGCHPRILEALARTNMEQTPGYGVDEHCERARALIREACEAPEADVHFLSFLFRDSTSIHGRHGRSSALSGRRQCRCFLR